MSPYNKFKWFTNVRKSTLPTPYPLLLRIRNGDFELSPYLIEAEEQRELAQSIYQKEMDNTHISKLSDRHNEGIQKSRMKRVKALKLDVEGSKDEIRILRLLREGLEKEFGVDLWELASEDQRGDGSIEDLYYWYKTHLNIGSTPSEIAISLGRKRTKGL
jgi:hypothetical protein